MDLKLNYKNAKSKNEAFKIIKDNITPEEIKKFKVNADLSYSPDDLITATGKGFSLDMAFSEDYVGIKLTLSLLLRPLRGKILDSIERKVGKYI